MKFKINLKKAFIASLLLHAFALNSDRFGFSCNYNTQKAKSQKSKQIQVEIVKYNSEVKTSGQEKCNEEQTEMLDGYNETLPDPNKYFDVPPAYIKRAHHYRTMIQKDMFPGLSNINIPLEELLENDSQHHEWKLGDGIFYLGNMKPVFWMDDKKMQQTLDDWMKLTKSQMVKNLETLIKKFDNNSGDLPKMVRETYNQNLIRIIYTTDKYTTMIDFFEEGLFKPDFLTYILNYMKTQPYTKTSTELLFVMEKFYMFEWQMLNLIHNRLTQPNPGRDVKIKVINDIARKYNQLMLEHGIQSKEDLNELYFKRRLEITNLILKNSDYRKNDALFVKGWLLFEHGRESKAYEVWSSIKPGNGLFVYQKMFSKIRRFMPSLNNRFGDPFYIKKILEHYNFEYLEKRGLKFLWNKKE